MTRDDIIRMAREARLPSCLATHPVALERFAALVAAAAVRETSAEYRLGWNDGAMMEREACAQVVDHILKEGGGTYGDAIRARGEMK